jgi:hypothetical protein
LLEPYLSAVDLPVRAKSISSNPASVVANGTNKPSIEIGIIGRERMTGLAIVFVSDRAQHATFVQVAGKGLRISATRLRAADERA